MTCPPDQAPHDPLPLGLEPFEAYLLLDQRPGYSMVFPLAFYFKGAANRAAIEEAIRLALVEEPLLTAHVANRALRWEWRRAGSFAVPLEWRTQRGEIDHAAGEIECPTIDLSHEIGLKVRVIESPAWFGVEFFFHHACADGVAANRFVGNVFARYGQTVGDAFGLDYEPSDPALLKERGRLDVELPEPLSRWQIATSSLAEAIKWLRKRPAPLASAARNSGVAGGQRVLWRRLDGTAVEQLRAAASCADAGLNDLLIRDLFLSARQWNVEAGVCRRTDLIQVLVPVNMRRMKHRRSPAANIMGYGFLTRSAQECEESDAGAMLRGISKEVDFIREWSLGALFLSGLGLFHRVPGALRALTSRRLCHATCVLSSLGPFHATLSQARFRRSKTIEVGDLRLASVVGAPPVRPNTLASVGVILHQGAMVVACAFDRARLDDDQQARFLDQYVERLRATADRAPRGRSASALHTSAS